MTSDRTAAPTLPTVSLATVAREWVVLAPSMVSVASRTAATILSFGIYSLWWERDVMNEGNRHFRHNWVWEDNLAGAVQQLTLAA